MVVLTFALLLTLATPHPAVSAGIHADSIVAETNAARAERGLPMLRPDPLLTAAAQVRAVEIAATGSFAHLRPGGAPFASAASAAGYPFARLGENLAMDFLHERPIVSAWRASPDHRRNLLGGAFRDIGVGVASGTIRGIPTVVVVELVGATQEPLVRGWVRTPSSLPLT